MSDGKAGGVVGGYCFKVQSYCPPKVVQRIFLFRSCGTVRGLWTAGSRGAAILVEEVGACVKNEVGGASVSDAFG
jgi:hypothetical protein